MTIVKLKPTSPGRRNMTRIINSDLYKGKPYHLLIKPFKSKGGRNNHGRITVRHKGGGHKKRYRLIDFIRRKDNILGKIERIEYDPNRNANIALILYQDGERKYIISPKNIKVGNKILSGSEAPIKVGNALPIRNIPIGTTIHCIEIKPGKGAQIARSSGTYAILLAKDGIYSQIRLKSGEIRKIHIDCRASIGEVGNEEYSLREIGKAGINRWKGIRPTVRGVAMNPIDHPHGGGEGKTASGRDPVSPWGIPTKGFRTRKNKRTKNMIIQRRNKI